MKKNEKKSAIINYRATATFKKDLENLAQKQNISISELSHRMLYSYKKKLPIYTSEKDDQAKLIISDLYMYLNQYKAGIDHENAIANIHKGVNELCHLYV